MERQPVVAYACSWWRPRPSTWSYTAGSLRAALDSAPATIVDVEAQRPVWRQALIAAAHVPSRSAWKYSVAETRRRDRSIAGQVARLGPDAVLGIADSDLVTDVPTFLYQDLSVSLGLEEARRPGGEHVNLLPASEGRLQALAELGLDRLRRAEGVFAMSRWYADDLVDRCGVAPERVVVAHAGLNSVPQEVRDPARPVEGRLLFVGVDFERKGGDAVVAATEQLHRSGHDVRLTVVGPDRWPLPGDPPPWVTFLGTLPKQEVAALLPLHDVFVMPSRFEAYGIAFVEALAAGLPCVARRAFAMPELVADGRTGRLVDEADPEAVAEAVSELLHDDTYHAAVAQARPEILERHDWQAIGRRMVTRMTEALESANHRPIGA